jgi:hypothetical protein
MHLIDMAVGIFDRLEISGRGMVGVSPAATNKLEKAYDTMKAIHRKTHGAEWRI